MMLAVRPSRGLAIHSLAKAWAQKKLPLTLMSCVLSHLSDVISRVPTGALTPAVTSRPVTGFDADAKASEKAFKSSGSFVTSTVVYLRVAPPDSATRLTMDHSSSGGEGKASKTCTLAPTSRHPRTPARPIPLPPPTTMTVRLEREKS